MAGVAVATPAFCPLVIAGHTIPVALDTGFNGKPPHV